jgi:hypothetical protein
MRFIESGELFTEEDVCDRVREVLAIEREMSVENDDP